MVPMPCQIEVVYLEDVKSVKRADCANYNICMRRADDQNWNAFSCAQCSAYCLPDPEQRMHDLLCLLILRHASHNVEAYGNAGRKPGVKEGSTRKVA